MDKLFTWNRFSKSGQFSWYDLYATFRDIEILILCLMATNINQISEFFNRHAVNTSFISVFLFIAIQIVRRFIKNYTK